MTKLELLKISTEKSNIISIILKKNYPQIYDEISKINSTGDKFTEKLYLYLNEIQVPKCKDVYCKSNCKFISLNVGYSTYCSNKCASNDTKDIKYEKIRKTFKEKYNVTSPSQLKSVKDKLSEHHKNGKYDYDQIKIKTKHTLLEKYGNETYNNIEKQKNTKFELYGNENFNNRLKFINTMKSRYASKIHPNTYLKFKSRLENNTIGFNSDKFKTWLESNSVNNASQIISIKNKIKKKSIENSYSTIVDRIKDKVKPNFKKEEFTGVGYYDVLYEFTCNKCDAVFTDSLYGGTIPRCTSCYPKNNHISIGQYELFDYLKSILPDVDIILNDTTILNGKELDIYIPSYKIAIEFNGLYFHSEVSGGKSKNYHLDKTLKCKTHDIRLIHINDVEWFNSNDIIKFRLNHIFNKTETSIYARKCEIVKLSKSEKSLFLDNYHLQKNDKSNIWIGLKYKDELVSVMTFGNLRNIMGSTANKNEYELYRYATKYNVIGGASKLLNYFIKNYTFNKIITYSKLDWGFSNFYDKIGFKFSHITPPNYWYIVKGKLIHRANYQKHKLKKILPIFDESLTEWDNMKLNGYDRIWDCGNLKFELHK
jgi:hypothetical protein